MAFFRPSAIRGAIPRWGKKSINLIPSPLPLFAGSNQLTLSIGFPPPSFSLLFSPFSPRPASLHFLALSIVGGGNSCCCCCCCCCGGECTRRRRERETSEFFYERLFSRMSSSILYKTASSLPSSFPSTNFFRRVRPCGNSLADMKMQKYMQ